MQASAFFNSSSGDRVYKAEDFAAYFASFIGNGVFPNPSDNLQVMGDGSMAVTVHPGKAWIIGYIYQNTIGQPLTLSHADGVFQRIDRVVVRWSLADRDISLQIKTGSPSPLPAPPDVRRDADVYELALADVLIPIAATGVTQGNITDLRQNSEVCGIVKGTVEEIDTTTLFNQFEEWFTEWFESIKEILDENVAATLLAMIEKKQDMITTSGILKGDGDGNITSALPDVDFVSPATAAKVYRTSLTLYVNSTTGSDANDGTASARAFKTSARLAEELNKYDFYLQTLTVNFAAGSYDALPTIRTKNFYNCSINGTGVAGEVSMDSLVFYNITGRLSLYRIAAKKVSFVSCDNVSMNGFRINGVDKSGIGVQCECSNVDIAATTIDSCSSAIQAGRGALVVSRSVSGSGNNYGLMASSGIILKSGTQPGGTTAETKSTGGQIFA